MSRKRRSVKRKVSRKRRSVKRKVSRKRRSAKRKTSRKRRSVKRKVKKKLKFRNGGRSFVDSYFKRSSGPDVGMVRIKNLLRQYKTGTTFSGKQILPEVYKGLTIIKPDHIDLCKHPELFAEFIYRLQKEMHDSFLDSLENSLAMEKSYTDLEKLYIKSKRLW